MLRVAIISRWHVHADDYAKMINELPEKAKIVCVYHENEKDGEEWAKSLGVDFEKDYDALLKRDDVDGVIITTATSDHEEVMVKAAKAKKHIFTEKVLAATVKECNVIAKAVKENNVTFCISFPQRATKEFIYAKELVDKGDLGTISVIRARNGHDGALANWLPAYWYDKDKAKGGAMIDLGCHPMYLSRWILGEPVGVSSSYSFVTKREVEDSAVCTVKFKNEAVAVVESSLITPATPYILEIYGEKGTLYINDGEVTLMKRINGELVKTIVTDLPETGKNPIEIWVDGIINNVKPEYDLQAGIELTELMEAANTSAELNKTIYIKDLER